MAFVFPAGKLDFSAPGNLRPGRLRFVEGNGKNFVVVEKGQDIFQVVLTWPDVVVEQYKKLRPGSGHPLINRNSEAEVRFVPDYLDFGVFFRQPIYGAVGAAVVNDNDFI